MMNHAHGLAEPIHPRLAEMVDKMREITGAFGSCTQEDLRRAGFSAQEMEAHGGLAGDLAAAGFVRQVAAPRDRIQDVIVKAIAAAPHAMPAIAGMEAEDREAILRWGRFCAARAAWKIDPWIGQKERCIGLVDSFLTRTPLLPRERNRVCYALAASMKVERQHG